MASYSDNDEFIDTEDLRSYPSKVKYLIDFAGPTDLSLLNTKNLNYDLSKIFASITNKEEVIKKYNPINYVSKSIPNTLIIHSSLDATVPYESSKELYDKCIKENSKASLIVLNSSVHDLSNISNNDIASISEGLLKFVIFNSPL
jgi:dipeptidyl aminopeptidase/acylaminoacyl peptidase